MFKLLSDLVVAPYHTNKRIHKIVEITQNQAEFIKSCGTTDAIHAAQLLMEIHRKKHRPLYIAFLDLKKAFDRVPYELIWLYDST